MSGALVKTVALLGLVIGLTATSCLQSVTLAPRDVTVEIPRSKPDLLVELNRLGYLRHGGRPLSQGSSGEQFEISFKDWPCSPSGRIEVWEREGRAIVGLRQIHTLEACVAGPPGPRFTPIALILQNQFTDYFKRPLENWVRSTDDGFVNPPELRLDDLTGCYKVTMSRWPKVDQWRLRHLYAIPDRLRLRDSLGSRGLEGYAGRRVARSFDRKAQSFWWEPIGPDSLRIAAVYSMHDGVEIRLRRPLADSMGVMVQTFDDVAEGHLATAATIRRIPCPR